MHGHAVRQSLVRYTIICALLLLVLLLSIRDRWREKHRIQLSRKRKKKASNRAIGAVQLRGVRLGHMPAPTADLVVGTVRVYWHCIEQPTSAE
jgi:hypothetical protein